jgi:hypothetical protein
MIRPVGFRFLNGGQFGTMILTVKGLAHFETSISVPYFDKRSLRPCQMKNISKYSSRV